jgi:F-type H+-transporting ATPase subunit delta
VARKAYARRYAQAVFQIALQKGELDRWQSDLGKIAVMGNDVAFFAVLDNPKIHFDDKAKLLAERLGDINPLALNLVYLLVAKGRLNMLADIAEEYQRLWDSYRGIERAEVITAVPLNDNDKLKLTNFLGILTDKKVEVEPEVDSRLLGGIVARVGGKLLDGSTRSRLEALKKSINQQRS